MGCANTKPAVDHRDVTCGVNESLGPDVVLLKVADLLNNRRLRKGGMTSYAILQEHWNAKQSIDGLFRRKSFTTVPWRQLKATRYAVLSYCWGNPEKGAWGATWSQMIDALRKKGKMNVKYVWVDIFCLDQNDPNKLETMKRTADICICRSQP